MKATGPSETGMQNCAGPLAGPLSSGIWLLCLLLAVLPAFAVQGGTGQADSSGFALDTRFVLLAASSDSGSFRLNTRFSPSTGAGMSAAFELDTRVTPDTVASLNGQVTADGGRPLAGAMVVAQQGGARPVGVRSDAAGRFQLSGLAPGAWQVWVSQTGYRTWVQTGVRLAGGGEARTLNVALDPMPALPNVASSEKPVEKTQEAQITTPDSTALQVFDGSTFSSGGTVDRALPTVIFTHGWDSGPEVWAQAMAAQMRSAGVQANLLTWNWKTQADTLEPVAAMSRTRSQGEALGRALAELLSDSYHQTLHFIGHSLGTLVNATAADYLHEATPQNFPADHTQMTLLDDAGAVNTAGKVVMLGYNVSGLSGSIASQVVRAGFVGPIPRDFAWVDNYISLLGMWHREAVNVYLPLPPLLIDAVGLHGYAGAWYALSVGSGGQDCLLGHRFAFERTGFPGLVPVPVPFLPGTSLSSDPLSGDQLDLIWLSEAQRLAAAAVIRSKIPVAFGVSIGQKAVDWAGPALYHTVGKAFVSVVEFVFRRDPAEGPPVPPDRPDLNLWTTGGFLPISPRFDLTTAGSTPPRHRGGPGRAGEPLVTNTPPAVWMTLTLPAEVRGMSFDFALTGGDANDDYLAFGINGTNRFALETRFLEPGRTVCSGWIDLSEHAGQQVELFFGVLGGHSTNVAVTVDGLNFYRFAAARLELSRSGSDVVLRWPADEGDFTVETATRLVLDPDWSPSSLPVPPVDDGGSYSVTNAVTDGTRFFRLRQNW